MSSEAVISEQAGAQGSDADVPVAEISSAPDRYHWVMLGLSVAVIVLACLLSVRGDQRVEFGGLHGWPIPELCQSKALFGIDCPGCGLTRSFIHLAHGDVAASFQRHRLGWLVALFVVLQIPYRVWAIFSGLSAPLGNKLPWAGMWIVVLLLMANWFVKLIEQLA
jgi:hypothetical protein